MKPHPRISRALDVKTLLFFVALAALFYFFSGCSQDISVNPDPEPFKPDFPANWIVTFTIDQKVFYGSTSFTFSKATPEEGVLFKIGGVGIVDGVSFRCKGFQNPPNIPPPAGKAVAFYMATDTIQYDFLLYPNSEQTILTGNVTRYLLTGPLYWDKRGSSIVTLTKSP